MIKAIIIEDEIYAMEIMTQMLSRLSIEVEVTGKLHSVKESLQYFASAKEADIIFSDVQLCDGLSFEIFKMSNINTPVIFTTAFDQYLLSAFENNGIDYLLKPVVKSDVEKSLLKYKKFKNHFQQSDTSSLVQKLAGMAHPKKRTRIIVKNGFENILVCLEDIILFYTENKVVYAIDRFQKKFHIDKNLFELEKELDPDFFFRANRKFIINLKFVRSYKPFEKVKLLVDLNVPDIKDPIIVSQDTAPFFRNWLRTV